MSLYSQERVEMAWGVTGVVKLCYVAILVHKKNGRPEFLGALAPPAASTRRKATSDNPWGGKDHLMRLEQ